MKPRSRVLIFPLIAFAGDVLATAANREWRFRATLDDKPIGQHHFFLIIRIFRRLRSSMAEARGLYITTTDKHLQ